MYIIHFKNIILNPCVLDVRICLSCSVMVRIAGCQDMSVVQCDGQNCWMSGYVCRAV